MNIYDFDGTIYDGDSTVDFWKFCARRHPVTIKAFIASIPGAALYLTGAQSKTFFKQRFFKFLRFLPDIESELGDFWAGHERNIKPWYLSNKQPDDIIISASPEFLLKPMCDKLGVRLIASRVDSLTGQYSGENCHGAEKVRRLDAEYPGVEIGDFYSDSLNDSPMAKKASRAYRVKGSKIFPWNVDS